MFTSITLKRSNIYLKILSNNNKYYLFNSYHIDCTKMATTINNDDGNKSVKPPSPVTIASNNEPNRTLETLNFDNLALRTLPIDPITDNYVRQVRGACFSKVD